MTMKILLVGDIVGKGGRQAVVALIPKLLKELDCEFCVANGENMAGGGGMTRRCLNSLSEARINVVTGGDHMWDQKDLVETIDQFPNVLRPANLSATQPGRGYGIFEAPNGRRVAVISLLGRTFVNTNSDCPFEAADRILKEIAEQTPIILVDFHAEATSEKIALGRYLDGRVTAVLGTHTHVPTADEQIFPGGTAFQCDLGMVGARESILGRAIPPILQRFSTGMPARFTVVEKGIRLQGAVVTCDPQTGRATHIERVVRDYD
jgi:metallophosphoesterase (TIGR00282 family)